MNRRTSQRLPALLLGALCVLGAFPVVRSLIVPDVNWCYPFMSSDSYDWINNGLYWAGVPTNPSFRPPGLPVVIALLWKAGALPFLPVLNFLVVGATAGALYALLRERFTPAVSALSAWVFFANDFVQDLTRYLMGEIYCTLFLVLAVRAFVRALRDRRQYVWFGILLGIAILFSHATLVAGLGLAVVMFLKRRADLKLREVWAGAAVAAGIGGFWLLARFFHNRLAGRIHHYQEELLYVSAENTRFYVVAGSALLGLALIPLYAAGARRALRENDSVGRDFSTIVWAPMLSLLAFWLFFYNWVDKRFLYYLFPFAVCVLSGGLEALVAWSRRGIVQRSIAAAYLVVALLWNQVRYPSYGINYVALSPWDFLEFPARVIPTGQTKLSLSDTRVVRLHESFLEAFSGGLFDFRLRPPACDLSSPRRTCLDDIRKKLDDFAPRNIPFGVGPIDGEPDDLYRNSRRIANVFLRPATFPNVAEFVITSARTADEVPRFECGPYRVYRRAGVGTQP